MEFEVTAVAQALGLKSDNSARITGWSVDSRSVAPGDLFFALRGPNHDGNVYVEEVLRKGAVAAVANDVKPGAVTTIAPLSPCASGASADTSYSFWQNQTVGGDFALLGVAGVFAGIIYISISP